MTSFRLVLPVLTLASVILMGACDVNQDVAAEEIQHDHSSHALTSARGVEAPGHGAADLSRMRAGTSRYHDFSQAVDDGFIPFSPCVASPMGGMGVHYAHPDRIADISVDPARPEMILYVPTDDGRMELVGVEFMVNAEAWHGAGHSEAPSVAGVPYDPPDPNHPHPEMAAAYTLHVWLWKDNPDGIFAPFNPNVSCPATM